MTANIDEVHLTAEEVATRWRMTKGNLNNLRYRGEGPPYVKTPSLALCLVYALVHLPP
jgi:hypothetical protein